METLKRFVKEDEGATMVEYGLLVALIAVFMIASITLLRNAIGKTFDDAAAAMPE